MARRVLIPLLLCSCLACDGGGDGAAKTEAKAASEAGAAEAAKAAPEEAPAAEGAPAPSPDPSPAPSQPEAAAAEPAPAEAAPAEPLTPLPPPTKAAALAAARAGIPGAKLAELAPLVTTGPRSAAIALRAAVEGEPGAADIVLALLDGQPKPGESETETETEASWTLRSTLTIRRVPGTGMDEGLPKIPTTVLAEDYDDDGELEVLVRYREELMCPGGGPNTITKLALVDVEPEPAIALATELHHSMVAPVETKAKVEHRDANGDGHRDVVIRYTTTNESEGEPTREVAENLWQWAAETDTWVLQAPAADAEHPGYARWGCDW